MMYMCKKCMKMCGGTFIVLGVLFLLRDLGFWDFWGIQWYSLLFLAMGLGSIGASKCPDCQAMRPGKK